MQHFVVAKIQFQRCWRFALVFLPEAQGLVMDGQGSEPTVINPMGSISLAGAQLVQK